MLMTGLLASLLVGAAALGWLLACWRISSGASGRPHGRDRRIRWVERHPGEAHTGDVERVLLGQGLSVSDARLVTKRAFDSGIKPFTMWMWVQAYGARELAVAVVGDLPREEFLEHLGEGTLPDFHELEVLAGLNGLEAAGAWPAQRATPCLPGPDEPGTWPPGVRGPVDTPGHLLARPRRLPPGWDAFFDDHSP